MLMKKYPVVLSIAGSDSSGGAGVQADIKTMSAIGVYASTAITAVTEQNTEGVTAIQGVNPDVVAAQIDAVFSDLHPDAVKIGMLFSKEIVETVADRFKRWNPKNVVLDPVMISTSGSRLIEETAVEAIKKDLFPFATLLTPNKMEAELLSGMEIISATDVDAAARRIADIGCRAVLVKGGHFDGYTMTDTLYVNADTIDRFCAPRITTNNTHGTGCTLSSAIASYLALGLDMRQAVEQAKTYLTHALAAGADVAVGKGHGPVNHFFKPQKLKII